MNINKTKLNTLVASVLALTALAGCSHNTSNAARTESTPLIPVDAIFDENTVTGVELSADGQWVAFIKEHQGIDSLFVMPASGTEADARLLFSQSEPIDGFIWAEEGNDIFYIQDNGGDEKYQIYYLDVKLEQGELRAGKGRKLSKDENAVYHFQGQAEKAPEYISYASTQQGKARLDVYRLNIETSKEELVFDNEQGMNGFLFDDMGMPRLASKMHADGSYEVFAINKGKSKSLLKTRSGERVSLLSYQQEQNLAYIKTSHGELDKRSLVSINMATGELKIVHQDPKDRSDLYSVRFDDDGQPLMVSYYYGYKEDYPLNAEFREHWSWIQSQFSGRQEMRLVEYNQEQGKWLLKLASDKQGNRYFAYDESNKQLNLVIDSQGLNPEDLADKRSITYKARDGEAIQAYLTLPKGQQTELPTVILPHGGPWARDHWTLDSGFWNRVSQLLANRGYAVLQPNFRASTGFGERFYNLGDQNWGTGYMQHDLTDGVKYLVEQGISDPERVGIMGGSYGGYAALAGITFTPDVYRASVSFVGPSSLVTLMNSFPAHYRPYLGNWFVAVGDPLIAKDVARMQARSPINFVDQIKTPLLLVQGANDPRVTQAESDNIAKSLYQKGRQVDYILAKDEGHGFAKRNNRTAFLIAMERFFAKHLGGKLDTGISPENKAHYQSLKVDIGQL